MCHNFYMPQFTNDVRYSNSITQASLQIANNVNINNSTITLV